MGKEISLMRDQKEDYQYEEAIKTLRTNIQVRIYRSSC